jgi:YD repeat-containing protein
MFTLRFPLIILFISFVLFSCRKEDSPNQQGSQLKMVSVRSGDSIFYRSFQYDGQNRVIAMFDSNNNGFKQNFSINYDAQGKISKVTEGENTWTFEFDDKGRIIKKTRFNANQQKSVVENTYAYDDNGRVAADSVYNYWTNEVYSFVSYSYDQSGNVAESLMKDKESGSLLVEMQSDYDNHPNPLFGITVARYFMNSGYEIPPGKNNLLKVTYDDGTIVNYTYEYYSNGLPKKRSESDNSDPLVTYTDYYYE